jgi:hypothetical protein
MNESTEGSLHLIVIDKLFCIIAVYLAMVLLTSTDRFNIFLIITYKFVEVNFLYSYKLTIVAEQTMHFYLKDMYPSMVIFIKILSDCDSKLISEFWRTLMILLDLKT